MKFILENMILDYGQDVYEKLNEITGLKFKSQIKDSGIVFKQIFEMTNLISRHKIIK